VTPPYAACRGILAAHSKSFALAARLLSPVHRDRLAAVYAWCREADDAIDVAPARDHQAALRALHAELAAIYAGAAQDRPAAIAFQAVVHECGIPMAYPQALLAGLAMDAADTRYATLADLYRYAYCVAGTVGLMACRVFGVTRPTTLMHGAHLGIAMQLTNVCRDVAEDWGRGRLYVPEELLPVVARHELAAARGGPLPASTLLALAAAVRRMLHEAGRFYRSADRGLRALDARPRLAIRTARLVYAAIGDVIATRSGAVDGPRAVVPGRRKVALVVRAIRAERDAAVAGRRTTRRARAEPAPRVAAAPWLARWAGTLAVALASIVAAGGAARAEPVPLTPGTYRLEMRYANHARIPMIGESSSTYRSLSLVTIVADGARLMQSHRVCNAEIEGSIPLVGLEMPPPFIAALGSHTYPVDVRNDGGEWRYAADLGLEQVGYRADRERPLPRSPDDPAIFDWDGDGKPGGTIRLRVPIAPDGELYVVQRGRALLDGRLVARDRAEGTIAIPLFEQAVIGAWPSFLLKTPEITPDTSRSRFTLVRLLDGSGCDAVLALRGAS
jgi:phytoene synthase